MIAELAITIIGAGLRMIDMVLTLTLRNYSGKLSILLPHSYLPQAYVQQAAAPHGYIGPVKDHDLLQVLPC